MDLHTTVEGSSFDRYDVDKSSAIEASELHRAWNGLQHFTKVCQSGHIQVRTVNRSFSNICVLLTPLYMTEILLETPYHPGILSTLC